MIGRDGPVNHFELQRWARRQTAEKGLKPLEAHVLLLLATYADRQAVAWPSVKTLALDIGLRVSAGGHNSSIAAALARLQELQLIWTRQAGRGQPAKRELLFNPAKPSGSPEGSTAHGDRRTPAQPSALPEGKTAEPSGSALRHTGAKPSGVPDPKYPEKSQNDRRATTSRSEEPDDALRHAGGHSARRSRATENGSRRGDVLRPLGDPLARLGISPPASDDVDRAEQLAARYPDLADGDL